VAGGYVVFAPDGACAIAAEEHLVRFAAGRRLHDRFGQAVVGLDAILLDPHIEDESAAGLILAIAAMAVKGHDWFSRALLSNGAAGTAAG